MTVLQESFTLANGNKIPKLGFGTWQIPDGDVAYNSVRSALKAGYTHLDSAAAYGNEASVGKAVRDSQIARDKLFVTTKIHARIKTYSGAVEAIQESLRLLNIQYIDLILIHAPRPWSELRDPNAIRYYDGNAAVWKAMEEAYDRGELKAIGVSNFQIDDLEHLAAQARIQPMVNQIRAYAGSMPRELIAWCQARNIIVEAYSPFATGKILQREDLKQIAQTLGRTVPQILLRYLLDKDLLPLPKSTHAEYIAANTQLDFTLPADVTAKLDKLEISDK